MWRWSSRNVMKYALVGVAWCLGVYATLFTINIMSSVYYMPTAIILGETDYGRKTTYTASRLEPTNKVTQIYQWSYRPSTADSVRDEELRLFVRGNSDGVRNQ